MRTSSGWYIFAGIMLALDIYVYQVVKFVSSSAGPKTRSIIFISYWIISVSAIILILILPYLNLDSIQKGVRSALFAIVIGLFLTKLIASVFFLVDDIRRGIQWAVGKLFFSNTEGEQLQSGPGISR